MKTLYPKIKFVYSVFYDRMLTECENKNFQERQIKEVQIYIKNSNEDGIKYQNLFIEL